MKITVGHLLFLLGTGAWAVFGRIGSDPTSMIGRARNATAELIPFMDVLKLDEPAKTPAAAAVSPVAPEEKPLFSEVPLTPVPPVAEPSAEVVPPASAPEPVRDTTLEPVVEEKKVEEKPVVKAPRRRRAVKAAVVKARPLVAKPAVAKPAAAKAATPKKGAKKAAAKDALLGTYVAVTLKTGNTVKGVLLERTATNYKIELPGMGGFDYPADTVKSIAPAE